MHDGTIITTIVIIRKLLITTIRAIVIIRKLVIITKRLIIIRKLVIMRKPLIIVQKLVIIRKPLIIIRKNVIIRNWRKINKLRIITNIPIMTILKNIGGGAEGPPLRPIEDLHDGGQRSKNGS